MRQKAGLRRLLLIPALAILILAMVVPYITMLISPAADPDPNVGSALIRILADDYFQEIALRTLRVALISTVLAVLLGFPVAYYLSKAPQRWRGLLLIAVTFPLLLNTVVRTFAWLVILGSQGVVSQTLQALGLASGPVQLLYTETALVIGLTQLFTPILILTAYSSLSGIHPHIEQAAAGLGAGPTQAFFRITLPLALPGTTIGATLVFAGSVTAFTTPALLGGTRNRTLATMLYEQARTTLDWSTASAIAIVMTVIVLAVTVLLGRLAARGHVR